jgi:agmatine deiminase
LGGCIESDGEGTLLTTTECLLNPNRNPHLSRDQLEARLREELGVETILWLTHGALAGDDTDAHIDTLARLCPERTIVYVSCNDPGDEHYGDLQAMEAELRTFPGFRLLPLPWPAAKYDDDGQRLPATYANFLVLNGAVLVPTYDDPADVLALEVVQKAFPDREILGIDCRTLILQHGSLHCVTMQIPGGVL